MVAGRRRRPHGGSHRFATLCGISAPQVSRMLLSTCYEIKSENAGRVSSEITEAHPVRGHPNINQILDCLSRSIALGKLTFIKSLRTLEILALLYFALTIYLQRLQIIPSNCDGNLWIYAQIAHFACGVV